MQTGIVSINRTVWPSYDSFERNFVLMHEVGHYELDTDSEREADAYALRRVYRTAPRSLKRSLQAMLKIGVIDMGRLESLYEEALKLDASDGNYDAYLELVEIKENRIFNTQKSEIMNPAKEQTYIAKPKPANVTARVVRFADGEGKAVKSHKTNGITIGGYYLSFTNVLLIVLIAAVLFKK
jgi:hypothetical protein